LTDCRKHGEFEQNGVLRRSLKSKECSESSQIAFNANKCRSTNCNVKQVLEIRGTLDWCLLKSSSKLTNIMFGEGGHGMRDRWEYKIVHVVADRWTGTGLPSDLNQEFDKLGADGWELVATDAIIRPNWFGFAGTTVGLVGFFKRPLPG
jgi:hypothetical protein